MDIRWGRTITGLWGCGGVASEKSESRGVQAEIRRFRAMFTTSAKTPASSAWSRTGLPQGHIPHEGDAREPDVLTAISLSCCCSQSWPSFCEAAGMISTDSFKPLLSASWPSPLKLVPQARSHRDVSIHSRAGSRLTIRRQNSPCTHL